MSYKEIRRLITYYKSVVSLCEYVGVESDGKWKLDSLYYMLGRL